MNSTSIRFQIAEAIEQVNILARLIDENAKAREILTGLRYFNRYDQMLNVLDRRDLHGQALVDYTERHHDGDPLKLGAELDSWLAEFPEDGRPAGV